jgi:two-component system cell cycle response regulator
MKILLAEDEPISQLMMRRTLEKFGYEVEVAENGREAVEVLSRDDAPRLALIDWMMPELDGPGLCREVRARHKDEAYVYILLLTSRQNREDVVHGLEAGADDYITKPCEPAELRARLHTGRRILMLEDKLVEAREEMRYKATHDALTKLWNRGAIVSLLRAELTRASGGGTKVSILLCDVDHFKRVNDEHGHLAGDIVLEDVGGRLSQAVRSHDAVGRYGGEEFLIVLSDCEREALTTRAEQVREAIQSKPVEIGVTELTISISVGAITCDHWSPEMAVERLLAEADAALYRAKALGRNRVVVA